MTRWRNEPLLHFAVLGIGLFALYSLVSDGGESAGSEELVVDAPRIAALADQFVRSWRRAPSQAELDGSLLHARFDSSTDQQLPQHFFPILKAEDEGASWDIRLRPAGTIVTDAWTEWDGWRAPPLRPKRDCAS